MTVNDLGTLRVQGLAPLTLGAPSRWTRGVWLFSAGACLLFLVSVAVSLGWLDTSAGLRFGRAPTLLETVFWLLPVVLTGFTLGMSLGGVRLIFEEEGLLCRSLWPASQRHVYLWSELRYARFWEEQTRSREQLYTTRLVFSDSEITFRLARPHIWQGLREQFSG